MKPLRVIAVLTCLGTLAACSSSGDGAGSSAPPSSAPPSSTPSSSALPSSSSDTSAAGSTGASAPPAGALEQALLTAAELGTGFAASSDQSDGDSALPCTPKAAPLFSQAPPTEKANRNFESASEGVALGEVVAGFADPSSAAKAFRIGSAGFACGSGTVSGATVKIVRRTLKAQPAGSPLDAVGAWDFATSGAKGTSVLVQAGSKIIGLTFVAKPTAGAGVDVGVVTDKAATKVLQAG